MRPEALRAASEVALTEELKAEPAVTRAVKEFDRLADRLETRRRLLSTAVRLTPALTPGLFREIFRRAPPERQ